MVVFIRENKYMIIAISIIFSVMIKSAIDGNETESFVKKLKEKCVIIAVNISDKTTSFQCDKVQYVISGVVETKI